jgi:hypothetical protein
LEQEQKQEQEQNAAVTPATAPALAPAPAPAPWVQNVGCQFDTPRERAPFFCNVMVDIPMGLIVNFNELKLTDGLSRLILPGSNMT